MPTDDLDRDKLYSAADDDDADYELEPLDPQLLDADKRRAAEVQDSIRKSIDIDEVYRDLEARRDSEILEQWAKRARNFRFQFQLKHLMIFTAVVAVLLTLRQLGVSLITFFVIAAMLSVGGVTIYLQWEEKKRQDAADRRRQQLYAERRAALGRGPLPAGSLGDQSPVAPPLPPDELDAARRETPAKPFRCNFSLAQFMAAFTCAALLLGFIQVLGGPSSAATLCGFIALIGLVIHAFYEPPEVVTFVWWVMLLMYIGLSIFAALWAGIGG